MSDMRTMKYSGVEAVFRGFHIEEDSPLMQQIRAMLEISPRNKQNEVSAEAYMQVLEMLAQHFFPELDHEAALKSTGRKVFEGYSQTILGRVQFAAANLMPPAKVIKMAPDNMNRNTNYGRRRWEQLGPTTIRFIHEDDPAPPAFCAGMFEAGLAATKAINPRVSYQKLGLDMAQYVLEWD